MDWGWIRRSNGHAHIALVFGLSTSMLAFAQPAATTPTKDNTQNAVKAEPSPFMQDVPAAAFTFEMRPIPASTDGTIKPFYMSTTEARWEAFDVFVYRLDETNPDAASPTGAAATTRPSKPYLPPDRGFGHDGYAAISLTFKAADEFCKWLSVKSGRKYRLATEAEWEHAARAGAPADAELPNGWTESNLETHAVFAENSDGTPKPVAEKEANAFGLEDMLGNVAEWCTDSDGKGVTKGGSYRTPKADLRIKARKPFDRAWQASDPQIPKSKWWMPDAPFVGFRIVCEMEKSEPAKTDAGSTTQTPK